MSIAPVGEVEVPSPLEKLVRESAFNGGGSLQGLVHGLSQSERDEICGWLLRIGHPYCTSVRTQNDRIVRITEDLRDAMKREAGVGE